MLLRASSDHIGESVDLAGVVGSEHPSGVPHGQLLVAFAEAVCQKSDGLGMARSRLLDAVGEAGFVDAAATVGIFNGLVRVADGCGIPLDQGTNVATADVRSELGLDAYGGAINTAEVTEPIDLDGTVEGLFA